MFQNLEETDLNQRSEDSQNIKLDEKYQSSNFNFTIKYPNTWEKFIATDNNNIVPMFNFYPSKNNNYSQVLPFDHHNNKTHVSVYPRGIPTEGIFASAISIAESGLDFPYELSSDSKVYVLEDGIPFAAYLKPLNQPDDWNSSGFVWIRLEIQNLKTHCLRNDKIISQTECDPLARGDQVIWEGEVDSNKWTEGVAVAQSFAFLNSETMTENDNIKVTNPKPNQTIKSPLELEGEIRGTWLFEASASVTLIDQDEKTIAETFIQTEKNWMTEDFVPFSGLVEFEKPEGSNVGSIIFHKANPSGLPEYEDSLKFKVRFE
ncbi:MAG: Gmad2 immunoglobulin-like domain-containing protein [Patescibacteria group bacterium]